MKDGFHRFQGTNQYIASDELKDAVNVSIALERPLLIKGEPGTGKTLLAENIARALDMPLYKWQVKSTSKAVDGLYVYDTVQRLNDSRFGDKDVSDIRQYIRFGPLGQAFLSEERAVVLIDEIDKADLEFPNDLLAELDEMSFEVVETGDKITAKHRPVIIITSNSEKELPDPFLRRCVFHFIDFPDENLMERIVYVHYPDIKKDLLRRCLSKFYWLRSIEQFRKKPSTSELVDWIGVLMRAGISAKEIEKAMPFVGVLLKKEQDLETFQQAKRYAGRNY